MRDPIYVIYEKSPSQAKPLIFSQETYQENRRRAMNYQGQHYAANPNQQPQHNIQPQAFLYGQPGMIYPTQDIYNMYHHMDFSQQMMPQSPQPQQQVPFQNMGPGGQSYPTGLLQMPQPVQPGQGGIQLHQPIPFSSPSPQSVFVATTPPLHNMNAYLIHQQINYPALSQQPQQLQQQQQQLQQQQQNIQQLLPQQQQQQQQQQQMIIQDEQQNQKELDLIIKHILNLKDPERKEEALLELSKKRESFTNLAPLLWHSTGTIALLIDDIVSVYSQLAPNVLTQAVSTQVCSVLGLLQCLALHQETKPHFIKAYIPLFLYPFLNTSAKQKPFENLRVTSLGVIGALVKGDDTDAITFLMQTEIIPLCLRIMKRGQELSRTVATFIVQKILIDDNGLNYICQTAERFFAVSTVLQSMIEDLETNQKDDQRLLRHIIRCYQRLSENNRANEALKKILPPGFKDPNWSLIKDESVRKLHQQLMSNLNLLQDEQQGQAGSRAPGQPLQQPMNNQGLGQIYMNPTVQQQQQQQQQAARGQQQQQQQQQQYQMFMNQF